MQINQRYHKKWKIKDFFNVDKNLNEGCKILRECLNLSDHDYFWGLVYYNFGWGNIHLKNKEIPNSTLNYICKVMELKEYFKNMENNNEGN